MTFSLFSGLTPTTVHKLKLPDYQICWLTAKTCHTKKANFETRPLFADLFTMSITLRKLATANFCQFRRASSLPLIYDSVKKELVPLNLRKSGEVTWYMCGPTVYDDAHIGHARLVQVNWGHFSQEVYCSSIVQKVCLYSMKDDNIIRPEVGGNEPD